MVRFSVTAHKIIGEGTGVQCLMKKYSHPVPLPPRGALDAVNEQRQILGTQVYTPALAGGRGIRAPIQAFGQHPEARPVIRQNLKPVAPFVKEDKQKTGRRLLLQRLFDQGVEAVETLTSIDGLEGQK